LEKSAGSFIKPSFLPLYSLYRPKSGADFYINFEDCG